MPTRDHALWRELGKQLRVDAIRASAAAGSGHPTSSMSAADLVAVLMARHFRYDVEAPENPNNDHLIFSKGHASPLLYAALRAIGALSVEELLTFRRLGSRLEGHPAPVLPWVEVATGSLGQGLPVGVGIALAGKRLDKLGYRTWVLCGDGEMAEGSMWEAFEQAGDSGLDHLTAIIDVNRLGQTGPTRHGWDLEEYAKRVKAFGWHAITIDGHDVAAIDRAYAEAIATTGHPTAILARTVKGSGVAEVADRNGWHGKPLGHPEVAIAELGGVRDLTIDVRSPPPRPKPPALHCLDLELPRWELGDEVATRTAHGEALVALGKARGDVVVLDGDVGNSTGTEAFARAFPDRFFQMYIAEQQLVAAAVGMQVRHWVPFASTFGAFFARAYDFVRMAAVSRADIRLVGSHAGVSIGEDGPSQMALEDLAAFRAVHDSTVLYPSDANQAAQLVALMANRRGISYLRVTRGKTPVIYAPDERFEIGGSQVCEATIDDQVTLVGAGITLHEALSAARLLRARGVHARVIDCYSVKPIDGTTLREAARATFGRIVVIEDHRAEGGLGDAVLDVFADTEERPRIVKLAVRIMPGSGTPEELLDLAGINARGIVEAALRLIETGHYAQPGIDEAGGVRLERRAG